jgi:chromosome segregation ATPase
MKSSQATIEEGEVLRRDLENSLKKKEADLILVSTKLDEEHEHWSQGQKRIKELQQRVSEIEEETEIERQGRLRAEKARQELHRELDELNQKLEEAGGVTYAQQELNKKREAELSKLRGDLEEANVQHESGMALLKRKHQEAVGEMAGQLEQVQKARMKLEKEKLVLRSGLEESRCEAEEAGKQREVVQRMAKQLEEQMVELTIRVEEAAKEVCFGHVILESCLQVEVED